MAGVCENNDRKGCQCRDWTCPLKDSDISTLGQGIALDEMRYDENDEICNREQCDDAGILQGIQSAQERKWYDNKPV